MQLHLGGHLSWYDSGKRSDVAVPLAQPTRLLTLIENLGLPSAEVAIAVVNGSAVSLEEALVSDGDRVQLYPPIGGGSDWYQNIWKE